MSKLIIKKDYVMYKFYKYGVEDTFDYFYWRNYQVFKHNQNFSKINIEGYDDEKYTKEETILIQHGFIFNDCFILPKGEYDCKCFKYMNKIDSWILNINGITLELKDLSKDNKDYFKVIL